MGNDEEYTYALPRIVTTQIQCAFGTYFWEMYTMEFGWTAAEYGKVQSLFNFTQCIFFIMFGIIFNSIYSQGTDEAKQQLEAIKVVELVAQVSFFFLILLPIRWHGITFLKTTVTKRNVSKTIASSFPSTLLDHAPKPGPQCAGCFNTPRMNAMRRFMGTRAFTVYSLVFWHGIGMSAFELCNKAIPVIIYPKKIKLIVDNTMTLKLGTGNPSKAKVTIPANSAGQQFTLDTAGGNTRANANSGNITDTKAGGTTVDNDYDSRTATGGSPSIPASGRNAVSITISDGDTATSDVTFTLSTDNKNNNIIQASTSNKGSTANAITIGDGNLTAGTSSSSTNKVTLTKEPGQSGSDLLKAAESFDWNASSRGSVITMNVLFFCGANLVVIWFFSFIRYYWRNDAKLAKTFLTVSVIFLPGQGVILWLFYIGIDAVRARTFIANPNNGLKEVPPNSNTVTEVQKIVMQIAPSQTAHSANVSLSNTYITDVIVHTQATKEFNLTRKYQASSGNDNKYNILDLQIIVLVSCLTIFHATVFFWIFTGGPLTFYVSENILCGHEVMKAAGVPFILIGFAGATVIFSYFSNFGDVSYKGWVFSPRFKKSTFFVCIATQFFTLLFFNPCDYSWNQSRWLNFMILIATGATNTMFVTYIYIVLDDVLKTYRWNWICYGLFFCVTNLVISRAMGIMFGAFGGQDVTGFKVSSVQVVVKHCFPCVYKSITITFWAINAMALLPIFANPLS